MALIGGKAGSPQNRPDAGEELSRLKRLRDIIVRARFEGVTTRGELEAALQLVLRPGRR